MENPETIVPEGEVQENETATETTEEAHSPENDGGDVQAPAGEEVV